MSACSSSSKPPSTSNGIGTQGLDASAPGVTSTSINVGLLESTTGVAAPGFEGTTAGVQARIDQQNANGGIFGRQIRLVVRDDQSSVAGNLAGAQALVRQAHVFGVMADSAFTFSSAQFLNHNGIPVVGENYDGPEWGEQPNTNMFGVLAGAVDPHYPVYTQPAIFMKQHGATNVAVISFGDVPSSKAAGSGFTLAARRAGLKVGYENLNLPIGTRDLGPIAIGMKNANVDTLYTTIDLGTNLALVTAARQEGVNLKVVMLLNGYGQSFLSQPAAVHDAQGAYFVVSTAPVEIKSAATKALQAALAKYDHFSGVPNAYGEYEGWITADLMIRGLELAGRDPTRSSFIENLHNDRNYNADGLISPSVNFSLSQFGKDEPTTCSWVVQLEGQKFVPVKGATKICGNLIPNSNQA